MYAKQTGKLNMYLATEDYLKLNSALLSDLPGFTVFFTELQAVVPAIQDLAEKQKEDITGITAGKNELRQKLDAKSLEVSKKMTAFAEFSQDNELKSKVKLNASELAKCNDLALRDYAQLICDITQVYVKSLAKYGITEQSQSDFQVLINNFNSSIPKNRLTHSEKKMLGQNLSGLFIRADQLIHNIDLEFEIIKPEQEQLYAGYKEIRRVRKSYTKILMVIGHIVDTKTGNPVKGAVINFSGKNGDAAGQTDNHISYKKLSAVKGGFKIRNLVPGEYFLTVTKEGYNIVNLNVDLTDNQTNRLEIKLEKTA